MFLERASSSSGATSGTSNHCRSNTFSWLWVTCGDTGTVCRGQAGSSRKGPESTHLPRPRGQGRPGDSPQLTPLNDVINSSLTNFLWWAGGSLSKGSHTLRPSAAHANHFCFQRRFTEDTAFF